MHLDLEYEVRTNEVFRNGLQQRIGRWAKLEAIALENRSYSEESQTALWDVIKYCNLNLAFLAPYFWPNYPKNKPLSFVDFPFAFQMFEVQAGGFMVFRGSRQIAKSTSFCCRQQLLARMLPGFKSLYLVPRYEQLETYQNKMLKVEEAMVDFEIQNTSRLRKNLNYKEFANGATIELAYALTDASRIRGKSTDELLFDEAQDFDPELEIEVTQTQAASANPITIYAGTSLTTDTLLEKKWTESSQGTWITKCPHCNHDNIPLPEHGVLDMIQRSGAACVKCGRGINVRLGRFIHACPQKVGMGRIGFHIPQIIVPAVANNLIRWAKIHEMKLKYGGDRRFLQEILGIAIEEGEREITKKHLMDICILGQDLQALRQKAQKGDYEFVVSGADWGGCDYIPAQHMKISTTVHVILGVLPGTGKIDILHIRRYSGMNYDSIVGDILHNHEVYRGKAIASDFGVGAVYNSKIREKIAPDKHLIFGYVGPDSDLLAAPKQAHMMNQWSLNKTESISLTFEAIRQARIRCFSWDTAEEYLSDCLNLFRAPGERGGAGGSGNSTFLYRAHPSKPNDTLMALNYGHMLSKILLGEPIIADQSLMLWLESGLRGDLGYVHGGFPGAISG